MKVNARMSFIEIKSQYGTGMWRRDFQLKMNQLLRLICSNYRWAAAFVNKSITHKITKFNLPKLKSIRRVVAARDK